jgi:hypothetical protein
MTMDQSRKKYRVGVVWPCATALALILAAAPLHADNNTTTTQSPFTLDINNPCFPIDHVHADGTTTTTNRVIQGGNGNMEFRTRSQSRADGFGAPSGSQYRYGDDNTDVFRFGNTRPTKVENRRDERLIAQDNNIPSFFHTHRSIVLTGANGGNPSVCHVRERCRCNGEDVQAANCTEQQSNAC